MTEQKLTSIEPGDSLKVNLSPGYYVTGEDAYHALLKAGAWHVHQTHTHWSNRVDKRMLMSVYTASGSKHDVFATTAVPQIKPRGSDWTDAGDSNESAMTLPPMSSNERYQIVELLVGYRAAADHRHDPEHFKLARTVFWEAFSKALLLARRKA